MASNPVVAGPTAQRVAKNIERVRRARGLNQRELSGLLAEYGRPMLTTVVSKIERGDRRVDVDDLIAFALALNVSPLTLLMPPDWGTQPVELTPETTLSSQAAWLWAQGDAPAVDFPLESRRIRATEEQRAAYARKWEQYQALTHPPERRAMTQYIDRALSMLKVELDRLVIVASVADEVDEDVFDRQTSLVDTWLGRLQSEVQTLVAQAHPGDVDIEPDDDKGK